MSKLRIFIENQELDSLDSVSIPITKQYLELSDPTIICNDYSKTITIPLSKNNNKIFGYCYNIDRLISSNTDETIPLSGLYFNPFKKLDCRLQWNDDVFLTGYAKMLKVTNDGYELTINAELGKIFQELQKLTFDSTKYEDSSDIEKYYIDGSKYVNAVINSDLVYKCWNSSQDDYTLREVTDANYDITDIIGFIPNNSFSSDFDYSTVELSDGSSKSMSDVLGEQFETNTGYSRDSVIGDGLYPVQMSQFRSYEQIPFIYWNKFWQIFANEGERLTGYKWNLDSSWFNQKNYNYSKLAITLLQRDSFISDSEKDTDSSFTLISKQQTLSYNQDSSNTVSLSVTGNYTSNNKLLPGAGEISLSLVPSISITVKNPSNYKANAISFEDEKGPSGFRVQYYYGSNLKLDYIFCYDSDNAEKTFKNLYSGSTIVRMSSESVSVPAGESLTYTLKAEDQANIRISADEGSQSLTMKIIPLFTSSIKLNTCPLTFKTDYSEDPFVQADTTGVLSYQNYTGNLFWTKTLFRTGSKFTLNNICNLDFSTILDYCKRYRIFIYVDELNKTLNFSHSYFNDITIKDMTDKVDKSTFDIEVPIFDTKYVLFGYRETDSLLGNSYKNIYASYPYGAKRLQTTYEFNDETSTLFEESPETILYSPTYLYWGELIENSIMEKLNIPFWLYNNNYLECRDTSGNTIDISGAYLYPVKKQIDRYWSVSVTDDSENQKRLDTYYNYKQTVGLITDYWTSPELSILSSDSLDIYNCCLFDLPKQNFTANKNYFDKALGIYQGYWEDFMNERYNMQNKKLTTYMYLKPEDYINFKFNQFWMIDNQVFMVNKICDYDITSDGLTKVELITVQDVKSYR